jgi:soluble lytic murein transglycosylase
VSRLTALVLVLVAAAAAAVAALVVVRAEPDWYQRLRYPLRYEAIVNGHARNYRLDPALLAAVIYTESKFDADAHSGAGAIGLMQLLPDTARGIALRTGGRNFVVDDLYVPELNVRYGSWYLRHLLDRYGDARLALAAYHAGQGNVDRWRARGVGVQFPETRAYVDKVLRLTAVYDHAYGDELEAGMGAARQPA